MTFLRKIFRRPLKTISFKDAMNLLDLPIITFYNNSKKLNFLLDTGSDVSYINSKDLEGLIIGPIEKSSTVVLTASGKTQSQSCKIDIEYDGIQFTDDFGVLDLSDSFNTIKAESGVTINGILGSKFFKKYRYVLDFDKLAVYIK